jgi:hypothetical protein
MMTERELESVGTDGAPKYLVPKADSEDRELPDEPSQGFGGCFQGLGVTGAVGNEDPIRL